MRHIDAIASDGSQLGVTSKTIWGDEHQIGTGGAEQAVITLCEEWTRQGDIVRFYNDPYEQGASPFEQLPVRAFNPKDNRDILIIYRSPNEKAIDATGLKVWFSTDQVCGRHDLFPGFSSYVDKVVTISPYHAQYFKQVYGIDNTIIIDLPIRVQDYVQPIEKIKRRFIFMSVPDRGLEQLWRIWPVIQENIPNASLTITSDYRLWGSGARNEKHCVKWLRHNNFRFLGAIPRAELIKEQMQAEMIVYPCIYPELFCIALGEGMVAGAYPITTHIGALATTNMGTIVEWDAKDLRGDKAFVQIVVDTLNDPDFDRKRLDVQHRAIERFSPQIITAQWDKLVFDE